MEALKKERRPIRREFENLRTDLENLFKEVPLRKDVIAVKFKLFDDNYVKLLELDERVREQLRTDGVSEAIEDKEYDEIRDFKTRAETIRLTKETLIPTFCASAGSVNSGGELRIQNFKLPTIQMKKFTGELKDWLGFWGQFQKVDQSEMCGSDKMYYLLQWLEPGTDAFEIASGYPPSNESYPLVIEALKRRFGKEDMLLQVYVREILDLVVVNSKNGGEKLPLKSLQMKLDSHLRALKGLNLEKADPATWLYPLVESCLPEKVIYNWRSNPLSSYDGSRDEPPRTRLDLLMEFLEKEVEINQWVDLSKSFNRNVEQNEKTHSETKSKTDRSKFVPTLSSFHFGDVKRCVFCGRGNHESASCFYLNNMKYDDKMEILKKRGLCYRCCGQHIGRNCTFDGECNICQRKHVTGLCRDMRMKQNRVEETLEQSPKRRKKPEQKTTSCSNVEYVSDIALQTVVVKIITTNGLETVRAFIDTGSQRSYILNAAAKRLQLKPVSVERVVHSLFGGNQTVPTIHNKYFVRVKTMKDKPLLMEIRGHQNICGNIVLSTSQKLHEELRRRNITLSDSGGSSVIEMLIGADMYPYIITNEVEKLNSGAVAVNTLLGWTVLGNVVGDTASEDNIANQYLTMSVSDICLRNLWELEAIGIVDPYRGNVVDTNQEMSVEFIKGISRQSCGRYKIKLPWKGTPEVLPTNKKVAMKRLISASRKLHQVGMFDKYGEIFKDWEQEGFVERVKESDLPVKVHYLSHRAVIKLKSLTTPVRPVFDASCQVGKNPSLNDLLFTGDNFILKIVGLLLKFREKRVAFVSDIRKAFQMIEVDENDCNYLLFMWWEDKTMKKVTIYKHKRVIFGATCSPFVLAAVLKHHLTSLPEEDKAIGAKLLGTLYVDNCISSEDTKQDYENFKRKATAVMNQAKMDLRMWQSNVDAFEDETNSISVLGVQWNRVHDYLKVNVCGINIPEKITKRSVLSVVHQIFDPIGVACPATLQMKILLQRSWIHKRKWDEVLPEDEKLLFLKWCHEIPHIGQIQIPRLVTEGEAERSRWQLVTFSDASKLAYATSVFLRVETNNGVKVHLLGAKSRVAPVKPMTIPKLELMSCLIGARYAHLIKQELGLNETLRELYYSDSTTAIAWIKRTNQWGTFVANRTKEINQLTSAENWRHLPGMNNPADLPSRGCSPKQLLESKWWEGPKWLYDTEQNWPSSTETVNEQEVASEIKKSSIQSKVLTCSVFSTVIYTHSMKSWIRIVGWIRRFLFNKLCVDPKNRRKGGLSPRELEKSEYIFLRNLQREEFPAQQRDRLRGLQVFEDEWGILRVKTRLVYRDDQRDFKYPIILPNNRLEVRRMVSDLHLQNCHAGVGSLLVKLRERFWITAARRTVKSVIAKCPRCRRYASKNLVAEIAPLPYDRVKNAEVFEVVGVDLAGPLILRNGNKVWIVIFTCGIYRAVHFELVKSISTRAFIQALGKFIKKYRRPAILYSDNGTNFRGTDNLMKTLDWDAIQQNDDVSPIQHKFIPVHSPWWGGWWERLIRTTKDMLKRTIGNGSVKYQELDTLLNSIADVMNYRPLTYVSEDPRDLEPLTPALFLHLHGGATFPEQDIVEASQLRIRLNYVKELRNELKKRFVKEYLALLVSQNPKKSCRRLIPGELVIVGNDVHKRAEWPLGRILEVIPGKDGVSRLAKVKTRTGVSTQTIQRLFPLELDGEITQPVRDNVVKTRVGRVVKAPSRFQ